MATEPKSEEGYERCGNGLAKMGKATEWRRTATESGEVYSKGEA